MAPSSRFTALARAQKGDAEPGHRTLAWRHHDQNTGADGRARQSRRFLPVAGTGSRSARCAGPDQPTTFDADWLRDALTAHGIAPVIPSKRNRLSPANYDAEVYKWRRLIKNFFASLKDNTGIATRYCKTDTSFSAFISIAATMLWLR